MIDHVDAARDYLELVETEWDARATAGSDKGIREAAAAAQIHLLFAVVERLDTLIGLLTPQDIQIKMSSPVKSRCNSCGRTGNHRCKGPLNE